MLWVFPAHAATYNTAQINGKYYPLTGVLNNPAVGAAVELGTLAITKANPWVAGIGTGLVVYKMLEELFPGTLVAFRPGLVSEKVDTWPNNQPPASVPRLPVLDRVGDYGYSATPYMYYQVTLRQAKTSYCLSTGNPPYVSYDEVNNWCVNSTGGHSGNINFNYTANIKYCNPGYTDINQTCVLSNASQVPYPSDGVSSFTVDQNGKFQPDPRDPDTPAASVSGISGSSSVTQKTTDGKQSSTTQANPDGSITHTTSNQYFDDVEGVLKDFKQSVTINNAGNVINYSTSNNAVNVTNGQTTPVISDFPNDYNRESTQLELKNSVKDDIQAANDAKTALGSGPNQPTYEVSELNLPNQDSFQVAPTEGMEALLPVNSGDCVTYPLNLPYFSGLVLDPCDVVAQVRPLVDWAVIAFGILAGLFIWFGKSAEPA